MAVTYPAEFHRQYTPAWLNLATILSGHRPRDINKPFRWCDIGCGQGFTALGMAALYPHAEIFGFDFEPSHIENATRIADEAGLSNAVFSDSSFEMLAHAAPNTWPKMDFIVLHGVWSWPLRLGDLREVFPETAMLCNAHAPYHDGIPWPCTTSAS